MTDSPAPRFYYGWVNVAVAAVAMTATLPGRTYGLGLIKTRVCGEPALGVDDLGFNVLNFWAVVLGAAVVPPVGRLIDRFGARRVLVGVSLALAASVLLMARAADYWTLAVTLTLVRGFGQGALSVVAIALVGKWFRRRVGAAMGVFTVLLGVGFAASVPGVTAAVGAVGWRAAWAGVGWSLVALALVGGLVARSTPEWAGVRPDDPAPDAGDAAHGTTLRAALATPAFWAYTAAGAAFTWLFSAVTLDNELLLAEHGLNPNVKDAVLVTLFLSGLAANFLAGWLARRVALRRLYAGGMILLALAGIEFVLVRSAAAAVAHAALLGAAGGVVTVVYFAIYGHAYGRKHLGAIQAAAQVGSVLASAAAPVVLAWVRDRNGGNTDPFFTVSGLVALAAVFAVLYAPVSERAAGGNPSQPGA